MSIPLPLPLADARIIRPVDHDWVVVIDSGAWSYGTTLHTIRAFRPIGGGEYEEQARQTFLAGSGPGRAVRPATPLRCRFDGRRDRLFRHLPVEDTRRSTIEATFAGLAVLPA